MITQPNHRPLVRVNQGCVRNPPEGYPRVTNIGTWNVQTLYQDGKLENLILEMLRLKVDILGVSETHWGNDLPDAFEEKDHIIIQSPRNDGIHRQGVAIIMSKKLQNYLSNYNLISERIMSIDIDTVDGLMTIFQIYAPDCSYSDNDVESFYQMLQMEINKLPHNSRYIILGDFNAKVGKGCDENWPSVAGKFSVGRTNERGERLLQFVLTNTLYKHKKSRLTTWVSPNGKVENQIDYIVSQKCNLKLLKNCRVYNSADVGSDHSLLMARFVMTVKKNRFKKVSVKRFDVERLNNPLLASEFEQKIGGRFAPLLNITDTDIDELYELFRDATNETTKEVVGYRKRKSVEGLSAEQVELCELRRTARREMLNSPQNNQKKENYKKLNREVKQAVKNAKIRSFERKVENLEDQHRKNDSFNLFNTVRSLEGKQKKSLSVVKNDIGEKVVHPKEVLDLWKEHFEAHLNTSFPHDINAINDLEPEENELPSGPHENEINKDEVRSAIRKMKKKKTPGSDEITTEVIKAGGDSMVDMLHKIFNVIWRSEMTPSEFHQYTRKGTNS